MGRRLGQHFLKNPSVLSRIAEAACPPGAPLVLEIGPGKGALTAHLLDRAERVAAIEIDPVLVQYLQTHFRGRSSLEVIEGDILSTNLAQFARPLWVAGNLPYYITSPIVEKILAERPVVERATFLVQKEVASRLAATPGSRDYGYLSVLTQISAEPRVLFDVPAGVFHPPPKVDSAVVTLQPRVDGVAEGFSTFAALCFRHKRKTLRNNLAGAYSREVLEELNLGKRRAEELSVAELVELHAAIRARASVSAGLRRGSQ